MQSFKTDILEVCKKIIERIVIGNCSKAPRLQCLLYPVICQLNLTATGLCGVLINDLREFLRPRY